MDRDALAREAKRIVDRLAAEPRAAGSDAEARARAHCAEILERNGFAVTEEEFAYSAFPGRWAVPLIGLLFFVWFAFIGSQAHSHPYGAATSGMPFLVVFAALGYMLVRMARSRLLRRCATNLIATRGGTYPLLLVAHLDSKSQPVPMLVRIAGLIVVGAATLVALTSAIVVQRENQAGPLFWQLLSGAGASGSLAMMLSIVGDRSPGAVDNATGVAAALLVATSLPPEHGIGVLITSAEELGLQGARAWARDNDTVPGSAINFDGIDDVGILTCMSSRRSALGHDLRDWSARARWRIRFRGVLPGIMVDALALETAGHDAVTISKGNFSTLARIHTPRDEPGRLTGTGVVEAVDMITNFLKREG